MPDLEAESEACKAADDVTQKVSYVRQVTGTLADPALVSPEFGRVTFRIMLPVQVVGMSVIACAFGLAAATTTDQYHSVAVAFGLRSIATAVALGSRIALHRSENEALAHRSGVLIWSILVVVCVGLGLDALHYDSDPTAYCAVLARTDPSIVGAAVFSTLGFVIVNASHGMAFRNVYSLAGIVLSDIIFKELYCGHTPTADLVLSVLMVMVVITHLAQLGARKAFLQFRASQLKLLRMTTVSDSRLDSRSTATLLPPVKAAEPPQSTVSSVTEATTQTSPSEVTCNRLGLPLFMSGPHLLLRPLSYLTEQQLKRWRELELKRDAMFEGVKQDEESQESEDGDALLSDSSSSAPSTPTRKRREMLNVFYELRHGVCAPSDKSQTRRQARHRIRTRLTKL